MSARVILTGAAAPEAMERASALLVFAALTGAGHEAIERGGYEPDAVTRRASSQVASWVYDLRYSQPMPEQTARMLAAALDLAGVQCRVEVQP